MMLVYCPVPDQEQAGRLARLVLSAKLAACANILPGVLSLFHWQGDIAESGEVLLLLKTREELYPPLRDLLLAHHPYQTPVIAGLPITALNPAAADWLTHETR